MKFIALAAGLFAVAFSTMPAATPALAAQMTMPQAAASPLPHFGKTNDFDGGRLFEDVYTKSFYCDATVPAKSSTGCEVGANYKVPPAKNFDPLYITVPLGFTVPPMQMQCPNGVVCVDHPATVDLSLIGGPVNAMTPGHDHFTTTVNGYLPEWWHVLVIGVKNQATYDAIKRNGSFYYITQLLAKKDPNVTAPIPTNLFLYFAVVPVGAE